MPGARCPSFPVSGRLDEGLEEPPLAGLMVHHALGMPLHTYYERARGMFDLPELSAMAGRCELRIADVAMVGRDVRIRAVPADGQQ